MMILEILNYAKKYQYLSRISFNKFQGLGYFLSQKIC